MTDGDGRDSYQSLHLASTFIVAMTAGVIAWHALVAAVGGVDLTDAC